MATVKFKGLCVPFSKLYKGNTPTICTIIQRPYATVDEGDTKVTHTGQVKYLLFNYNRFISRAQVTHLYVLFNEILIPNNNCHN